MEPLRKKPQELGEREKNIYYSNNNYKIK
jgi:hypothetical protein